MDLRTVKVDLHNHLEMKLLDDSENGFDRLVDFASQRLGKGGILGVTNFYGLNHYPIYDSLLPMKSKYHKLISDCGFFIPEKDLMVVRGEEVATKENGYEAHLLMLGTPNGHRTPPFMTLDDALKVGEKLRSIMVAVHPFYRMGILRANDKIDRRDRRDILLSRLDVLEIYNGEAVLPGMGWLANTEAIAFFASIRDQFPYLYPLISSDGHSVDEVGRSYTELDLPENFHILPTYLMKQEFLKALSKNRFIFRGQMKSSPNGALRHAISVLKKEGLKKIIDRLSRS